MKTLCLLMGTLLCAGAAVSAPPDPPGVVVVGHRATVRFAPENTVAAIHKAIELGAHLIEIDIRETADGELVVMHDATVTRTTDGEGLVAKLTLTELKGLDAGSWFDAQFAGERVPTVAEALDAMAGRALPDLDFKAGDPEKLVALLRERELVDRVTLHCGNQTLLQRFRELAPELNIRPTILAGENGLATLLERYNPPIVNIDWRDFSPALIERVHAAGRLAFVNTLGEEDGAERIEEAVAAGADFVQSDHVDVVVKLLRERQRYPAFSAVEAYLEAASSR